MHLKGNEVTEGTFGCIWSKDGAVILKKGTEATQLLVRSSKDKAETIAIPESPDKVGRLYTLIEMNYIYSIHIMVCSSTSTHVTCMS